MGGIVLDSGYACLTSSEFSKGFFREGFSLALKPSLASELAEKLQTDRWGLLKYYSSLAPRLDEIDAVAREGALESGKALVARTVKMCEPYFPPGTPFEPPPVSVVVFRKLEGRGYVPVIMDVS